MICFFFFFFSRVYIYSKATLNSFINNYFSFLGLLIIYWSAYRGAYNEKLGLNSYFVKQSRIRMHVFTTPSKLKIVNEINKFELRDSTRDLGAKICKAVSPQ